MGVSKRAIRQVTVPVRTVSEANARRHWRERQRRAKQQREATLMHLRQRLPPDWGAYTVTLTRIAPRPLDDDNLASALKACRDGVADYLLPANRGNKKARWADDSDGRIVWLYRQEQGEPKTHEVRIEIRPREHDTCPTCGQPMQEAA